MANQVSKFLVVAFTMLWTYPVKQLSHLARNNFF